MMSSSSEVQRRIKGRRRRRGRVLLLVLQANAVASFSATPYIHQSSVTRVQHGASLRPGVSCVQSPRSLPVSRSLRCQTSRNRRFRLDTTAVTASADDSPAEEDEAPITTTPPPRVKYQWTKQNLAIALPALIGMLADPLLSLMDTAYVGRVGSTELAALGACTSIFHLAFNAFRATTAATTSLVATALQDDPEQARQVTSVSLQFGLWVGVAVCALLVVSGNSALAGMGVSRDSPLYKPAAAYLFTRCWAAPIVLLIGVAEGAFRGYGNTIVPALASLTAALMNLVLDPVLIFAPVNWGVRGAAAATAMAQVGAAAVYAYKLVQRNMLPSKKHAATPLAAATATTNTSPAAKKKSTWAIVRTILGANLAMLTKQGSLLLAWAVATARATRLGAEHVAAHQVLLSVWLVFALILDGAAVSAQVLSSRAYAAKDRSAVKSLTKYMVTFAILQGLVSMLVVRALHCVVPTLFTPDPIIQGHLHKLMPVLAFQQVLVSVTLVVESLAVGASQFKTLALGTTFATVVSIWQLAQQTSVEGIWNSGIVTLFCGRLATAVYACVRAQYRLRKSQEAKGGDGVLMAEAS